MRSSHRRQPLKHLDTVLAIGRELRDDPDREGHLYLTDYRSLYVAHVDEIVAGDVWKPYRGHAPAYYDRLDLLCDFWYKLVDVRRLVADDSLAVISELKQSPRNVNYYDQPVSPLRRHGGPAADRRPRRWPAVLRGQASATRSPTSGSGWSSMPRAAAMAPWRRTSARTCSATWSGCCRPRPGAPSPPRRRSSATIATMPRSTSVPSSPTSPRHWRSSCNAILHAVLGDIPEAARRVNVDGATTVLGPGRHLTLGQFAHALTKEPALVAALESAPPARRVVHRQPATYRQGAGRHTESPVMSTRERVGREVATGMRDKLVGVGLPGVFNESWRGSSPSKPVTRPRTSSHHVPPRPGYSPGDHP